MKKVILSIDGMTCSACSNGLEKYLKRQEGIKSASVNLVMATASIEYSDELSLDDLGKMVEKAGFKSLGVADLAKETKKDSIVPFVIFGVLALTLMYISMAHMWKVPTIKFLDMTKYPEVYAVSLLILTLPFIYFGFDILKSGINNLLHKMPNMDTLVSLGVMASFSYSLVGVIGILNGDKSYLHKLYFESVCFVIYFIKLGRFIDKSSKEKTKEAIKKLVLITPKLAKLKTKAGYKEVSIDEVKKDDILMAFAGDKIAVDGEIVKGETHINEAFITGESVPVKKSVGDSVVAGAINYDGVIEYKALRIGKESTISEIVRLVVEATNTKAPIASFADKISSYFVPGIMLIALLTFIVSLILGSEFSGALTRFVTILVVACPCALGLATPLAIVVGEGVLAKDGILVRTSETLENASSIDTIVFDKTGTLTNGNLTISKIYNYSELSDYELLRILGGIEANSTHPIAKGITNYIESKNISVIDFEIENMAGMGIKASKDGEVYYAGNAKLVKELGINNSHSRDEEYLTKEGNSIVYIVKEKTILGLVGIKDIVREEAKECINSLKKMGIDVIMLTGDNDGVAKKVGKELGIEHIIANVVPKEKAEVIKKLKMEKSRVMMVGDGINDAPSLALADIGVSISSGTDIAADSSDVILMNNKLNKIVDLITISKKTLINIKENLFWAFFYNVCMIPIAAGVFKNISINPSIACIAMIISSLLVVFNALRLNFIKIKK